VSAHVVMPGRSRNMPARPTFTSPATTENRAAATLAAAEGARAEAEAEYVRAVCAGGDTSKIADLLRMEGPAHVVEVVHEPAPTSATTGGYLYRLRQQRALVAIVTTATGGAFMGGVAGGLLVHLL
jgi:hypothetical protein